MKSKKYIILIVIFLCVSAIMLLAAITTVFSLISKRFVFNGQIVLAWVAIMVAIVGLWLAGKKGNIGKQAMKANNDLEDTHFLTPREIKNNAGLMVTKFINLCEVVDGVPVAAKVNKQETDAEVILAKPIHTLVIGTTGSGKTTTFVSPSIEILSRTKSKPSLVITDPKGELYTLHADTLKKQGYKVQVLNLSEVYNSARWNPFSGILAKQAKIDAGIEKVQNKYKVFDKTFDSLADAEKEFKKVRQTLIDEIYADMADIIYTMCPVENQHDSTWQKGARDLVFAVALALWEDVRDKKIKPEQLSLFNIYKILTEYANDNPDDLIAYLQNRNQFSSKVWGLAKTVLVTTDKTLTSYLGDVSQYISFLNDRGIQSLTAGNDIDFTHFDEKPNALFIKIPDSKENRHKLVSLLLVQMYKALVDKAGDNQRSGRVKTEELLRTTYFILDEFGNLPKLNNLKGIITVGRSRKIFMTLIIQSFEQLNDKYGKEVANIVKSNCNIKIFIQSSDVATTEEFSKLCGKHKIVKKSFSENKDTSVSVSVEERPLITPHELQNLNDASAGRMGNAVVLALGKNPLKAVFTPCFKAKSLYPLVESALADVEQEEFSERELYVDITKIEGTKQEEKTQEEQAVDNSGEWTEQEETKVNDEKDKLYKKLEKKLISLKLALKPFLTAIEFESLINSDMIEVFDVLETLIEKLQKKDIVAAAMAIELKSFVQHKMLTYADVDQNTA
ncbi:MAG: type IV secretory system conjugative DNA transfer family protein [Clostridia bacterium]|nr:type IV secretory system conjugative DNA transfer family protein [Clostridia bacterium]